MNSGTVEETTCFALLNALSWILDPASWVRIHKVYHQAQVWTEGCQMTMPLKCRSAALFCGGGICITAATLWGSGPISWSKITVSMNMSSLNLNCIELDVLLVTAFFCCGLFELVQSRFLLHKQGYHLQCIWCLLGLLWQLSASSGTLQGCW